MKPLDEPNFYNEHQSWFLKQHWEHNGRKLRFVVKRNAYEEQSGAVVQIQDQNTMGWLELARIPYSQMKADGPYVLDKLDHRHKDTFFQDLEVLRKNAQMLID